MPMFEDVAMGQIGAEACRDVWQVSQVHGTTAHGFD